MIRIMVLAGGNDQIALIMELRDYYKETFIILVDYLADPIAKPYADKHIQISTLNREEVLGAAIEEKVQLIITACTDQATLTMAFVAEKLNLPCYVTYQQALELTNKKYMKQKMKQNRILTSKFQVIHSESELQSINLNYPLVIKPVDSNSSKGVTKISTKSELLTAYQNAVEESLVGETIIEEYVEGMEYSVDILVKEGVANVLLITNTQKLKNNLGKFTIVQSAYKPCIEEWISIKIAEIAQQIANSFAIKNAPMIIQVLIQKKDIFVIEFSVRTGGGSKIHLIQKLTGVNVLRQLLSIINNEEEELAMQLQNQYVFFDYVYVKKGTVARIEGIDYLLHKSIIDSYYMYKNIGCKIEKAENSSDRIMGILIMDSDCKKLIEKQSEFNSRVCIFDEQGKDIMIHNIYEEMEQ